MSGHSKWAQIKRQKGAADIKRGQIFTKISNAITIAVRQSGGAADPEQNFKLRLAVEKARSLNMPKENIQRAIEKALGKGEKGEGLQEAVYEGFAPCGVAVIVEVVTDNKQRTASEIKNIFDKNGGTLATPGAVSYQFKQKGQIIVKKDSKTVDDIFLLAADSGAEDVEEAGDEVLVYTKPEDLTRVRAILEQEGLTISDAELTRKSIVTVGIENSSDAQKVLSFTEKLEELDDVQKVFANFDIPEQFL